jgi:uncharacterized protein
MSDTLIGRKDEQVLLLEALHSNRAEMVAVFGRRRVGKTFLIKQTYQDNIVFEGFAKRKLRRTASKF